MKQPGSMKTSVALCYIIKLAEQVPWLKLTAKATEN